MNQLDLKPLEALRGGFLDATDAGRLHPDLLGEPGLRLKTWLAGAGVGADLVIHAAETFRGYADRHADLGFDWQASTGDPSCFPTA